MTSFYNGNLKFSIFGESHSPEIGITVDGLPAGFKPDFEKLQVFLDRRAPGQSELTTQRKEADVPEFICGIENGKLVNADKLTLQIVDRIENAYNERNRDLPEEEFDYLRRHTVLEAIDRLWQEHLYAMDNLRSSMSLRVYAQKDPLVEYKHEAFGIFKAMMDQVYRDIAHNLFRVTMTRLSSLEELLASMPQEMVHQSFGQFSAPELPAAALPGETPATPELPEVQPEILPFHRETPKVGRNDLCPCGSGKKYKKCCGKNA